MSALPHLVVVGSTASGKSAVAMAIARARRPEVELVSADSMQVYRGMDVGTAKPSPADRGEVAHHLIDVADPDEDFSVARFQKAAGAAVAGIEARGHRAVLVGGTGLYLRSVVDGLHLPGQWPDVKRELETEADTGALHRRLEGVDPVAAGRMEATNRRRIVRALEVTLGSGRPFSGYGPGLEAYPPTPFRLVGLRVDRAVLDNRIAARFDAMVAAGLVDEVRRLSAAPGENGGGLGPTARQALGYKEILRHLDDGVPLDVCVEEAVRRTRRLARRQEAWFGRDPRVVWYDASGNPLAVAAAVLGDWERRCRP